MICKQNSAAACLILYGNELMIEYTPMKKKRRSVNTELGFTNEQALYVYTLYVLLTSYTQ